MTAFYAPPHRFSESLNVMQYAAVTHPGGPLLVSAGTGTGKTRVLTYRVAWLLDQGVLPSAILMLTFSCSAAQEMLARALKLAGRTKTSLQGGTFHSVGCDFLRRHGHHIGLPRNFTILDQSDSESIIGQLRAQHSPAKGFTGRAEIMNLISAAASRMQPVEESGCTSLVARIAADYTAYKSKNNLLDFDDLLLFFHRLLTESAAAREKITSQFQHILVDEYQDTNRIQAEIVRLLAPHGNVTAVGDWAQAVYSFRGADADCIRRFQQRRPA
jgi:DNA helicase II / ATP-dependent DNA helicase PcrA